jgi:cysteine-rich repeat protein
MKSLIGKLGMLALLATAAGSVVAGCSSSTVPGTSQKAGSEGPLGEVGLKLVPVSGVTLNTVHYVVTNNATPALTISEGDLPTPGTAKDFSFGLSLPVGTGYTISLSAASAETGDNITCGGSYGTFNVAPNTATNFSLTLTCHDDTNGQIVGGVDVKTDACPKVVFDYVVATPGAQDVGKDIDVLAKAHDLDGKSLTYTWKVATPATGAFTPVAGATSKLHCAAAKVGEIVTVTADNGECKKSLTTTVSCNSLLCGNGVVDPGEQCDKAIAGVPCPADCTYTCGDGVAEAPVEDCDPGNTANCTSTCKTRPISCGDNFLTTGEICDPTATPSGAPDGQICKPDCSGFAPAPVIKCGDGIINGTEQCDDAVAPSENASSPTCSSTCKKVSTTACVACENNGDCFESVNNCQGVAAPFALAEQALCYDVMGCIESSNCFDGTGTLGKCYCGDLSISACGSAPFTGAGSPNGACVAQIKAGFPTFTSNSAILGGLVATDFPSGAAMKRLSCQKGANSSACLGTCGFTAGGPVFP